MYNSGVRFADCCERNYAQKIKGDRRSEASASAAYSGAAIAGGDTIIIHYSLFIFNCQ